MANQLILGRALDANGYIAPGAKATIYADGTSTLVTVYSDVDGTTPATNPIVADGDGFWPQRYVTEDAKAVVTTSADVALYTLDPAPVSQGTGAAASQISFSPTVPLPQTNVQAAIEAAAALAVSGFATFGLGITGNATLLANLDATGTGAGVYRFDGTTTGTFPTGVAAADTGLIELWRQAGATAMMELHHATSNRVFRRRMTASTWGAWREIINVDQATVPGDTIYRGASAWTRLAKGTALQVLRMNSGATAPEWASESGWEHVSQFYTGTSVANVDTPAFESGYDYAIRASWVRGATNPSTFLFQAFKAVAGAYTPTIQLKGSDSNYSTIWLEILAPMQIADQHRYRADLAVFSDNNTVAYAGVTAGETNYITVYGGVDDRISGLRFTRGAGNVSGGSMSLFRRPTRMT